MNPALYDCNIPQNDFSGFRDDSSGGQNPGTISFLFSPLTFKSARSASGSPYFGPFWFFAQTSYIIERHLQSQTDVHFCTASVGQVCLDFTHGISSIY